MLLVRQITENKDFYHGKTEPEVEPYSMVSSLGPPGFNLLKETQTNVHAQARASVDKQCLSGVHNRRKRATD